MHSFKLNFEIGRLTGSAKVCVKRHRRVWLDKEINIRDIWTEPSGRRVTNKDSISRRIA